LGLEQAGDQDNLRVLLVVGVGCWRWPGGVFGLSCRGRIDVLRRDGSTAQRVTDGDTLRLRMTLPETAVSPLAVDFAHPGGASLASCTIEMGQAACETAPFSSLGWYWETPGTRARPAWRRAGATPLRSWRDDA